VSKSTFVSAVVLAMLSVTAMVLAQTDPGVQSASRGTGATIINPANDPNGFTAFFNDGFNRFQEVETVSNSANVGLGPRFNSNQCSSCHAQPAVGGSGAAVNPQYLMVSSGVAPNDTTPSFLTANGPTLEARAPFFLNSSGAINPKAPNGGVEYLFTVTGRSDAGSCSLSQPNFTAYLAANDLIFRIPTPTFGAGLIENLDDSTLLTNQAANLSNTLGIAGTFNHSGNDGTITRFGWKAQNKSLHIFAGEAYNVEMGVSNELFPQDRPLPEEELSLGLPTTCLNLTGTGYPEDTSNPTQTTNAAVLDDVSAFANFMRFLAPPPPGGVVLNGAPVPSSSIPMAAPCSIRLAARPATIQARVQPRSRTLFRRSARPRCLRSPTLRFTTWVLVWRTTSRKAALAEINSAPLPCGVWDRESFCSMTAAPPTCLPRSRNTRVPRAKPLP